MMQLQLDWLIDLSRDRQRWKSSMFASSWQCRELLPREHEEQEDKKMPVQKETTKEELAIVSCCDTVEIGIENLRSLVSLERAAANSVCAADSKHACSDLLPFQQIAPGISLSLSSSLSPVKKFELGAKE
jgi:hypothetical protein